MSVMSRYEERNRDLAKRDRDKDRRDSKSSRDKPESRDRDSKGRDDKKRDDYDDDDGDNVIFDVGGHVYKTKVQTLRSAPSSYFKRDSWTDKEVMGVST